MIAPEYLTSILILIAAATLFVLILICHLCLDFGLYNSHRSIQSRRQKHQKSSFNLRVALEIKILKPIPADVPKSQAIVNPVGHVPAVIPSKAFKLEILETNPDCIVQVHSVS